MNEIDTLEMLRFKHYLAIRMGPSYEKVLYANIDLEVGTVTYEVFNFGDMRVSTKSIHEAVAIYNKIGKRTNGNTESRQRAPV